MREALAGGLPVEQVVLSERYAGDPLPVPPEKQLLVSEAVFAKLSEEASPQGVLAVLRVPACTPRPPKGNSLLLDGIADPGNLGTIIRTANGAGYEDLSEKLHRSLFPEMRARLDERYLFRTAACRRGAGTF